MKKMLFALAIFAANVNANELNDIAAVEVSNFVSESLSEVNKNFVSELKVSLDKDIEEQGANLVATDVQDFNNTTASL